MSNKKVRKLTFVTMLMAMAIAVNIFESTYLGFLPYGIRFGLANIMAIVALEMFGIKEMIQVNVMRVVVSNLLRGTILGTTFWVATSGVVLSSLVLIIVRKMFKMPLYSTSMLCAIAHSVGQVMTVAFIYQQDAFIVIVPMLLISAIPTGILTGIISTGALKRLKKVEI